MCINPLCPNKISKKKDKSLTLDPILEDILSISATIELKTIIEIKMINANL